MQAVARRMLARRRRRCAGARQRRRRARGRCVRGQAAGAGARDVRALLHLVEHGSSFVPLRRCALHPLVAPPSRTRRSPTGSDRRLTVRRRGFQALSTLALPRLLPRRSHLAAHRLLGADAAQARAMTIDRAATFAATSRSTADLVVVGTGAGGAHGGARGGARRPRGGRARRGRLLDAARLHAARGRDAAAALPGRRRAHHRRRRHHRCCRAAASAARRCTTPTCASARPTPVLDGWNARRLARRRDLAPALRRRRARSARRAASSREPRQPQQRDPASAASRSSAGRAACSRTTGAAASARASASWAARSTPRRTRSRCSSPRPSTPARASTPTCRAERVARRGRPRRGGAGARARRRTAGAGPTVTVRARAVCLAGSAVGSAALALAAGCPIRRVASGAGCASTRAPPSPASSTRRSKAGTASRRAGSAPRSCRTTTRRPTTIATWIITAFAHPIGLASSLPGFGAAHMKLMRLYPRIAVLAAMLHDRSEGSVAVVGRSAASINYALDGADQRALVRGHGGVRRALVRRRRATRWSCRYAEPLTLSSTSELGGIARARLSSPRSAAHGGASDGHARARPRRRRARPLARRRGAVGRRRQPVSDEPRRSAAAHASTPPGTRSPAT